MSERATSVLLTGGAGYIGAATADALLADGHRVVILDDLSSGHTDTIPNEASFKTGSYGETDKMEELLRDARIDVVVHCGAKSIVAESDEHPDRYFANNVQASLNLLNAACNVGVKRMVFSSSAAVYGAPTSSTINEATALAPVNTYGATKVAFELALRSFTNAYEMQSIKMTLYRTSGDSTIARHLIKAAELGKQVAVVLELKARFDEARNVSWAKELEYAGVHVTYGLVGLKTHAKCILVVRSESGSLRRYVHIGTGNYNSVTARIYEDIGYFTSEPEIGRDATELFNYLTGYAHAPEYQSLLVAPHRLKTRIIELIDKEASFAERGRITMKMNSISDPDVIEALYRASQAGVRVDLVVRGICCLRAGVTGLSENISVRSILGRQLEHSRIYRFEHGLDDDEPLHLIGSADMMERNLKGRVETLVPLTHPKHRMWLDTVLGFLLADDVARYSLGPDNEWSRGGTPGFERDAQSDLHAWVTRTQVR